MKKVLLLIPQNIIPAVDGGKKGIYMPMKMLAQEYQIKAIIFCDTDEKFDIANYAAIKVEAVLAPINKKDSLFAAIKNIGCKLPFKFAKYFSKKHVALVHKICNEWRPDILICHHAHLAEYCADIKKKFPAIKLLLREHNVEYLLVEQYYRSQQNFLLKYFARWQYKKTRTFEIRCWEYFDSTIFISDDDFKYFTPSSKASGYVIYDGSDKIAAPAATATRQNAVLFSGSMRSYQNQKNLSNFINTVWIPWKTKFTAATPYALWITGDENKQFVRESLALSNEDMALYNIKVLGFVDDLVEVMHKAAFFLSPTIIGAGIRIKLLDALGCGCVVFVTEKDLAISGTLKDGENVLLYCDTLSFNTQLNKVATDNILYNKIALQATQTAQNYFSWQVFYKNLKKLL